MIKLCSECGHQWTNRRLCACKCEETVLCKRDTVAYLITGLQDSNVPVVTVTLDPKHALAARERGATVESLHRKL